MRTLFCLGLSQFVAQAVREPCHDLILHLEEICHGFVKPFGPEMITSSRVNQLHIYPKPIATSLHRAFEQVPDVQLAADLREIDPFPL
jgi:hypothetical protein